MAKQPRFTPTEDNNEVVVGDITIELEVGKAYTKAALVKALEELEEVPLIESTAEELIADFGVVPGEEAEGDGSGEATPPIDDTEKVGFDGDEPLDRTIPCPHCKKSVRVTVKPSQAGSKLRTKCQQCNATFSFNVVVDVK